MITSSIYSTTAINRPDGLLVGTVSSQQTSLLFTLTPPYTQAPSIIINRINNTNTIAEDDT